MMLGYALHFAILLLLVYLIFSITKRIGVAVALTLLIGIGKEIYDPIFSGGDIVADVLGILHTVYVLYDCQQITLHWPLQIKRRRRRRWHSSCNTRRYIGRKP